MRYLILFFLLCLSHNGFSLFLPKTDDIPLMDGITLQESDTISFDTPAGHILTFVGKKENTSADIMSFYRETLTSLGWTQKKDNFFQRGNETLQISFLPDGTIRFDITLVGDSSTTTE